MGGRLWDDRVGGFKPRMSVSRWAVVTERPLVRLVCSPSVALTLAAFALTPAAATGAPSVVPPIPWVGTNADTPHVTLNGQTTTLKAIAEHGDCGGAYTCRWDWNGDGDFDDAGEEVRNANANSYADRFAPLEMNVDFPESANNKLYLSRVRADCGQESVTALYPTQITVDRICPNYPAQADGDCVGDDNLGLTRRAPAGRAIDDGLRYLFKQASHGVDGGGRDVHTCHVPHGSSPCSVAGQSLLPMLGRGQSAARASVALLGQGATEGARGEVNVPLHPSEFLERDAVDGARRRNVRSRRRPLIG